MWEEIKPAQGGQGEHTNQRKIRPSTSASKAKQFTIRQLGLRIRLKPLSGSIESSPACQFPIP